MNWIIYFLFISASLPSVTIGGEVYVIEAAIALALLAVFLKGVRPQSLKRLYALDVIIISFAVFGLLSVVSGSANLWESARYYRASIMMPTLLYFAFRLLPLDEKVFIRGLYLMIPFLLVQALLLIRAYVTYGGRQQFYEGSIFYTITLAALFVIALSVLFYLRNEHKELLKKIVSWGVFLLLFIALYLTFSRTSFSSFVLLLPVTAIVWKRTALLKIGAPVLAGFLVFFMLVVISGSVIMKTADIDKEKQRELQHSSDRLHNTQLFIQDLTARFQFWSALANRALEHPVFGEGGASATMSRTAGGRFQVGSSHNFLVTALLVSGLPGVAFFILIIYSTHGRFPLLAAATGPVREVGKALWVSYICLIMVGLTGGLGGGRMPVFFALTGMIMRLSLMPMSGKSPVEKKANVDDESSTKKLNYIPKSKKSVIGNNSRAIPQ